MKRRKRASARAGGGMKVIRPNVAGIDVGSREHWVCGPQRSNGQRNVRQFGATTAQLEALVQ